MKKFLRKFKVIFAGCMVIVLLSTTAYGSEVSNDQNDEESQGGMYTYCVATGEVTYTPPDETETHSDETEGFSPGYNPFADEDNIGENLIEPYYLDSGRTIVENPQNDKMFRSTVYIDATFTDDVTGATVHARSTEFMIGPNAVATAGHCIFMRDYHGENFFVGNATIIPAYNTGTNSTPYGAAHAPRFICGEGWSSSGDDSDDWGIIELDTNIGSKTGWLVL